MPGFESLGRMLVFLGLFIVLVGLALMFAPRLPFIGRLPGDIFVRRDNFTLYFPLVSCLLLSLLLTVLLNLVFWILRR
jgi:uncharacterized protein HemY